MAAKLGTQRGTFAPAPLAEEGGEARSAMVG